MKLKNFLKFLVVVAILGGLVVGYAMFNDYKREQNTNEIVESIVKETDSLSESIQTIIDSTVVVKQEELPESLQDKKTPEAENDVSSIVSDAVNESVAVQAGFSELKALTSDTFECIYNGEPMKFRLIGLKSNGSADGLQTLLDNATDLNVEYDTIKTNSDGMHLVYLWNGEQDDDCNNMINMQMIFNSYATSTYISTSDSIIETPNIKYSTTFIRYQKLINNKS